jgi:hypothetical protein
MAGFLFGYAQAPGYCGHVDAVAGMVKRGDDGDQLPSLLKATLASSTLFAISHAK